MRRLRSAARLLVVASASAVLSLACGCYLAKQGAYVIKYQSRARPVERVLNDPAATNSLKQFIRFSRRVRQYAIERIGLTANRNYTTFVDVPGRRYLLDVVCASAPDTFRPYQWRFPFFGAFPYMGYFDRADAVKEADRLKAEGLDVLVRESGAFSSLGFFRDPLYSFMREWPLHDIASVIIHEQAHVTLFVKNQVDFNEQFATFVGDQGSLDFMREAYGDTSGEYRAAVAAQHDDSVYMSLVRGLHQRLDSAYRATPDSASRVAAKTAMADSFAASLLRDRERLFQTEPYRRGFTRLSVNNAWVLSYMTYVQDLGLIRRVYEAEGRDLRRTVAAIRTAVAGAKDPAGNVRQLVRDHGR